MKFIKSVVQPLLKLLSREDKKKGLWIVVLLTINSILDFFNLASFLPLIYGVINPSIVASNKFLHKIYVLGDFQSVSTFLGSVTVCIVVFAIIKNIISRWVIQQKATFAFMFGSELSSRTLTRYLEISYLKFTRTDFSKELDRIVNHPIAFANNIVMPIGTILSEGILFIILVACIIFYNPTAFFFLIIVLIPIVLVFNFNRKSIKEISDDLKKKYPLSIKYALQVVEGIVEIRSFKKESFFTNRYTVLSQKLANTFAKDHVVSTGTSRLSETAAICVIGSLVFYSLATRQNYQQTIVMMSVYAGISFRLIPSLNRILNSFQQIKKHEFIFVEMVGLTHHGADVSSSQPPNIHASTQNLIFQNKIELNNISFRYPDSSFGLKNITLTIHKGEKISISGKSGAGKTSLLLILLGLLTEYTGEIKLDEKVLFKKDHGALKHLFGYVSQNPYILDGSWIENIALGVSPEEVQIEKILQLIQYLDLGDLVHQLPNGLATQIGEKGVLISGGQRQRIAIARALYLDAEILLLDEITNHLDGETQEELMNTLSKLSESGKTIIVISHHLNPTFKFDHIIKLAEGSLVDEKKIILNDR